MPVHVRRTVLLAGLFLSPVVTTLAEPVAVRYLQGSTHGFLTLKTLEGKTIASGEVTQTVRGTTVSSRFTLRFKDGSVDAEQTVFTQRGVFRLVSDHHTQHGPSFPKPIDVAIDVATGTVTTREKDGSTRQDHLDIPPDVANGLPPNLLLNILTSAPETKVSYIAPGTKPRLVHLSIKPEAEVTFTAGSVRHKAMDYRIHVELGGVAGVVAPMVGKQPADYHIWIAAGAPPFFLREEGPLYEGGPIWRIEQTSPSLRP